MIIPNITIEQLLEAGVHLGHKTLRWNPKMKKYIFGRRDTIHIIDLTQTVELIKQALEKVYETISNREKCQNNIFGTKIRQHSYIRQLRDQAMESQKKSPDT